MHKLPYVKGDGQTDRQTDRQTDGQTDGQTDKLNPISLRFTGDNYAHFFFKSDSYLLLLVLLWRLPLPVSMATNESACVKIFKMTDIKKTFGYIRF